ncbi:MAG: carbonic anhydrase [Cryomorphaceae bacterium]
MDIALKHKKENNKIIKMDIKNIFKNNQDWVRGRLDTDSNYFNDLSKGQNPDILYIGCSDSRVTAEELMGLSPGEAFVHRNIANMVPNTDLSAMSVIDYAVLHLKVNHVVVCGHYYCGGVKAAMESADLGILNPWLRNIRDVYRTHRIELSEITDDDKRYKRLVELNVQEQCINVIKTAEVQRAYRDRGLTVHGWVFDIHSGKLIDLNIDFSKILKNVMEIYHLD